MQRFFVIALVAVAGAAGCGGEAKQTATGTRAPVALLGSDCKRVGDARSGTVHLCWQPNREEHGRFVVGSGGERRTLALPAPSRVGHWAWAKVSPDGETILAQWSAECEVPIAYLISIAAGSLREAIDPVYSSRALAWTDDGRAIVEVVESACGPNAPKPGIYFVDPHGGRAGPFQSPLQELESFEGRPVVGVPTVPVDSPIPECDFGDPSLELEPIRTWNSSDGVSVGYLDAASSRLYACDVVSVDGRRQRCALTWSPSRQPEDVERAGGGAGMCAYGPWRAFAWIAVPDNARWALVDHGTFWTAYAATDDGLVRVSGTERIDAERGSFIVRLVFLDDAGEPLARRDVKTVVAS